MDLRPAAAYSEDAVLVERVRADDQDAFRVLYRRYARTVASIAYRVLGDDSELDDVVQETFLSVSANIGSLREPELFRAWLIAIAVRSAKRRLSKVIKRRGLKEECDLFHPRSGDMRARSRVDDLYEALDSVPTKMRIPWVLNKVEGLALQEVADACGVSLATVKRRIGDAEVRLKRKLDAD